MIQIITKTKTTMLTIQVFNNPFTCWSWIEIRWLPSFSNI